MLIGSYFNEVAIGVAEVDRCYWTKSASSLNRAILDGHAELT